MKCYQCGDEISEPPELKPQQLKYYKRGWHDGVLVMLKDLINHGETGKELLTRMEFWTTKIEKIKEGKDGL